MSGGLFDYGCLFLFASKLETDIEENDILPDKDDIYKPFGYGHSPEIIKYMRLMIQDIHHLHNALKAYDYLVYSDIDEDRFLEIMKSLYPDNKDIG